MALVGLLRSRRGTHLPLKTGRAVERVDKFLCAAIGDRESVREVQDGCGATQHPVRKGGGCDTPSISASNGPRS
jgi:hypothetical protein